MNDKWGNDEAALLCWRARAMRLNGGEQSCCIRLWILNMRHGIVTHRSLPPFFHTIPSPLCGTALYTTSSNNVKKLMKLPISFVSFYQSFFTGFLCVQSYSASTTFFFVVVVVGRDLTDAEKNANKTKKGKGTFINVTSRHRCWPEALVSLSKRVIWWRSRLSVLLTQLLLYIGRLPYVVLYILSTTCCSLE